VDVRDNLLKSTPLGWACRWGRTEMAKLFRRRLLVPCRRPREALGISLHRRGELFHSVPMGYVILPAGEVDFDPDEQARNVMRLVFDKFEELGSIDGLFR
jgi:hypothetical protein